LLSAAVLASSHVQAVHAGAHGSIEDLAIGNRAGSWQLAAFHTAPEFDDATPHDKLWLGEDWLKPACILGFVCEPLYSHMYVLRAWAFCAPGT
jgi:hypothetical protein